MQQLLLKSKEKRISSGVYGLDSLIGGGLKPHSINIVHGNPGCGKSTFAWQFIVASKKEPALYVSLEQSLNDIIRETNSLGLKSFETKVKSGNLHFHHTVSLDSDMTASEVSVNFLVRELPKHIEVLRNVTKSFDAGIRIVIDPITPLLFEVEGLNQLRNVLSRVFCNLREIGTSIITIEKGFDEILTRLPLYLGDSVFELDYLGLGGVLSRIIQIKKMRGSSHSEKPHPLFFEQGTGLHVKSFE